MINQFGNIFEGTIPQNGKINGFCVFFIGNLVLEDNSIIHVGWFKDNQKHGNCMKLRARDLEILQSGWYEENQHIGPMRHHS